MKKIGILGSGIVAKTLAGGFIKYGYQVCLGTNHPEKLADWKSQAGGETLIDNFENAAAFGDIVVLAVKGKAATDILHGISKEMLSGKTIIDTGNPIEEVPPKNGVLSFFTGQNHSLMEELQATIPEAHFVKAFNSIGSPLMINPDFNGVKPTMFICGDNEAAKKEVAEIVELFGFDVADMGEKEAAGAIESLCILWCIPGMRGGKWDGHAFKLLKR